MGKIPRRHQLAGWTCRLPLSQASSCSCSMLLSHAEVGFCDFLQSLFAVTCHFTRSAMQVILPALALSLYLTDGGDDDTDNGGDGGDGDNGRVSDALLLLVAGRYSIQVGRMWRVFYLDFLHHDIPLVEDDSHHLHDFPRQNIRYDSWMSKECFFYTSFRKDQLFRIYRQFGLAQLAAQDNGSIRVFTGFWYYHFDPKSSFSS